MRVLVESDAIIYFWEERLEGGISLFGGWCEVAGRDGGSGLGTGSGVIVRSWFVVGLVGFGVVFLG